MGRFRADNLDFFFHSSKLEVVWTPKVFIIFEILRHSDESRNLGSSIIYKNRSRFDVNK